MTLRPGKLDAVLLAELLTKVVPRDPRVIVGPGIGRDAAVIDLGDRMLVAKTDPVTFATERIGWYAVNVNANDIACMGARPAWFLATALLPEGGPDTLPAEIFDQLIDTCARLAIELVGGHTEVTLGLDRPMIIGAMLGEATRDQIVTGENIQPGDAVLLTKGVAIEGTALLAHEASDALRAHGVTEGTIRRARALLDEPGISIVPDAQTLCSAGRPKLLHDPTEGGIATALEELAAAAAATLRIDDAAIPVRDETREVCGALSLDHRGLLASGALLAIVDPAACEAVTTALAEKKIMCHRIGTVESGPQRVIMGADRPYPHFARDEIARYFDGQTAPADDDD